MESIHSERQSVAQLLSYTGATAASHADASDRKNTLRGACILHPPKPRITLAQAMIFVDVTRFPHIASHTILIGRGAVNDFFSKNRFIDDLTSKIYFMHA